MHNIICLDTWYSFTFSYLPGFPGGAEGIAASTQRQLKEVIAHNPVGALLTFVNAVEGDDAAGTKLLVVAESIHLLPGGGRANDGAVRGDLAVNPRCEHRSKGELVEGAAQRLNVIRGVVLEQQGQDRYRIKIGAGVEEKPRQKVENIACRKRTRVTQGISDRKKTLGKEQNL